MPTTKRRIIPFASSLAGQQEWIRYSGFVSTGTLGGITARQPKTLRSGLSQSRRLTGTQVTTSEVHPAWKTRKSGHFKGDLGGRFHSVKQYCLPLNLGWQALSGYKEGGPIPPSTAFAYYQGPVLAIDPANVLFPPTLETSDKDLEVLGSIAINRVAPTNPAANLSTFIGELAKEGIPSMLGSALQGWAGMNPKDRRKAIAQEHLNYEFGWKPIMNDLKKLASSIAHFDKVLSQYERDSGRLIRRRYDFPPVETTESMLYYEGRNAWINATYTELLESGPSTGRVIRTRKITKKRWFSGAFTYYIPKADGSLRTDIARKVIQAKKTLGLSLTPSVIWNLAPWSWALDWFGNVGDVLENVDAWIIDGLVLRYGYMMENTIVKDTYTFVGPSGYQTRTAVPEDVIVVSETKKRIQATPYGFGKSWNGFTPRQLAILTSLGISKQK